jgi:hypothetical protein
MYHRQMGLGDDGISFVVHTGHAIAHMEDAVRSLCYVGYIENTTMIAVATTTYCDKSVFLLELVRTSQSQLHTYSMRRRSGPL